MLSRSFDLVEGLIEIAYQRKWLETCISTIRFSQCLVQALWTNSHSLEQLPHFGEQEIKAVTKGPKPQAKTLGDYLKVPDADKKGLSQLSDEQKEDVLAACRLITLLSVKTELFVEEEEKASLFVRRSFTLFIVTKMSPPLLSRRISWRTRLWTRRRRRRSGGRGRRTWTRSC